MESLGLMGMKPDMAMAQMQQGTVDHVRTGLAAGKMDMAAIRKAATDFEAVFASQMLSHMFSGIKPNALFGGGNGEDVFRSLMVDQYGRAIAQSGGLGIADKVAAELIKLQGQ